MKFKVPSPKLTYIAPENGWFEDDPFLFWVSAYFQGYNSLLVPGIASPLGFSGVIGADESIGR